MPFIWRRQSLRRKRHTPFSTLDDSSVTLESSPILTKAWPRLKEMFAATANADGEFPLMTDQQEQLFQEATDAAQEKDRSASRRKPREAAVLMILCSVNGEPSLLFTKRAAHMSLHGGEISFPGGHFDAAAGDIHVQDTAIRETHEELLPCNDTMLSRTNLSILGPTSRISSLRGTPVAPFLAVLWPGLQKQVDQVDTPIHSCLSHYFPGDSSEVAAVFSVSITDLLKQETTHILPNNRFGLVQAPCFPVPGHGNVWGLTASITLPILRGLFRPVFQP
jgi:hypothetical protein